MIIPSVSLSGVVFGLDWLGSGVGASWCSFPGVLGFPVKGVTPCIFPCTRGIGYSSLEGGGDALWMATPVRGGVPPVGFPLSVASFPM